MIIDRNKHNRYTVDLFYNKPVEDTTANQLTSSSTTIIYTGGSSGSGLTEEQLRKLNSIEDNAQRNQNAFSYLALSDGNNTNTQLATILTDTANLSIVGLEGITVLLVTNYQIDSTDILATGNKNTTFNVSYKKQITTSPSEVEGEEDKEIVTYPLTLLYVDGDTISTTDITYIQLLDDKSVVKQYLLTSDNITITQENSVISSIVIDELNLYFDTILFIKTEETDIVVLELKAQVEKYDTILISNSNKLIWYLDDDGNARTDYNAYSTKEISAYGLGSSSGSEGNIGYLYELKDVDATTALNPINDGILQYNASTKKWQVIDGSDLNGDKFINKDQIGADNGVAPLTNGKISEKYLPSYVDDVVEYSSKSLFPATGESGKIYIDTSDNVGYRWTGSLYVAVMTALTLGYTSTQAFPGNEGKEIKELTESMKYVLDMFEWDSTDIATRKIKAKASLWSVGEVSAYGYQDTTALIASYLYLLKDVSETAVPSVTTLVFLVWEGNSWKYVNKDDLSFGVEESSLTEILANYAKKTDIPTNYYDSSIIREQNTVLAAPSSSNGIASFRKLTYSDLPDTTIINVDYQDYRYFVVGLFCISDTWDGFTSYPSIGSIYPIRRAGAYWTDSYDYNISNYYQSRPSDGSDIDLSEQSCRYAFMSKYNSYRIRPCTFIYNGKKYAGIVSTNAASIHEIRVKYVSKQCDPFFVGYYNRNSGTILNQEIYNSIRIEDTDIKRGNIYLFGNSSLNGDTILTSGNYTTYCTPASHATNLTIHITDEERTNWNIAYNKSHSHSNKSVIDKITDDMLTLWNTICGKMYVDENDYLHSSVAFVGDSEVSAYGVGEGTSVGSASYLYELKDVGETAIPSYTEDTFLVWDASTSSWKYKASSDLTLTDTKNTAGSTNTSDKLYLVGAKTLTTQSVTYSHDTAYVGTDGALYSEGKKVSTSDHTHPDYITDEELENRFIKSDTYSNIYNLAATGQLEVGKKYCITDYQCIYKEPTTLSTFTMSMDGWLLILTADTTSAFNENIEVRFSTSSSYVSKGGINIISCKYDINNDTSKYQWAVSSGKGVIYYLEDANNNKLRYDFKHIKFRRYKITNVAANTTTDSSTNGNAAAYRCFGNSTYTANRTDTRTWIGAGATMELTLIPNIFSGAYHSSNWSKTAFHDDYITNSHCPWKKANGVEYAAWFRDSNNNSTDSYTGLKSTNAYSTSYPGMVSYTITSSYDDVYTFDYNGSDASNMALNNYWMVSGVDIGANNYLAPNTLSWSLTNTVFIFDPDLSSCTYGYIFNLTIKRAANNTFILTPGVSTNGSWISTTTIEYMVSNIIYLKNISYCNIKLLNYNYMNVRFNYVNISNYVNSNVIFGYYSACNFSLLTYNLFFGNDSYIKLSGSTSISSTPDGTYWYDNTFEEFVSWNILSPFLYSYFRPHVNTCTVVQPYNKNVFIHGNFQVNFINNMSWGVIMEYCCCGGIYCPTSIYRTTIKTFALTIIDESGDNKWYKVNESSSQTLPSLNLVDIVSYMLDLRTVVPNLTTDLKTLLSNDTRVILTKNGSTPIVRNYYDLIELNVPVSSISRTANTFLAAPSTGDGVATFRTLTASDMPSTIFRTRPEVTDIDSLGDYNLKNGIIYVHNAENPTVYSQFGYGWGSILNLSYNASSVQIGFSNDHEIRYRNRWYSASGNSWSSWRKILHTSNYNSYCPKLDGTGATGTWGISISGNAATATKLGTSTIGSSVKPIYLSSGTPTACSYSFGNANGNIPISNGTLNTNLNADLLDGYHFTDIYNGGITTSIGTVQSIPGYSLLHTIIKRLGATVDGYSCVLLICKLDSTTEKELFKGCIGRLYMLRGTSAAMLIPFTVDINVCKAYNQYSGYASSTSSTFTYNSTTVLAGNLIKVGTCTYNESTYLAVCFSTVYATFNIFFSGFYSSDCVFTIVKSSTISNWIDIILEFRLGNIRMVEKPGSPYLLLQNNSYNWYIQATSDSLCIGGTSSNAVRIYSDGKVVLPTSSRRIYFNGSTEDNQCIVYDNSSSRLSVGSSEAKGFNVGSLLVSSAWSDYTKVPTNGIYSKGNIISAGEVTAYSSSDINLKTDIKPISSALQLVDNINPISFKWNDTAKLLNTTKDNRTNYGVIALELKLVLPELTHTIYDKYLSVDYVLLIPILILAIKELKNKINELASKYSI